MLPCDSYYVPKSSTLLIKLNDNEGDDNERIRSGMAVMAIVNQM